MPKGRMLNRKIAIDEKVAQLSPLANLLFTWMIPFQDSAGRMMAIPESIKGIVCPLLKYLTIDKIKDSLKEMDSVGLIKIYGNGMYLQFNGFSKNQTIDTSREAPSSIPPLEQLKSNSGVTQEHFPLNSEVKGEVKGKYKDNILCAKAHEPTSNEQKPPKPLKLPKETDTDLSLVIKYIYDSRLKKTGNKYIISGKLAKNLKNLCRVHTHAAVCAAWSIFINDKLDLKDREFWCKGYSPDSFTNNQCFSLCQEAQGYKDFVKRHEVETFGYKPISVKCDIKSFGG